MIAKGAPLIALDHGALPSDDAKKLNDINVIFARLIRHDTILKAHSRTKLGPREVDVGIAEDVS